MIDGEPLPEGTTVTVLAREGDESFVLDQAEEAELLESMAEGDRGYELLQLNGRTSSVDAVRRRAARTLAAPVRWWGCALVPLLLAALWEH